MEKLKQMWGNPKVQGQLRHLLSALGPLLGLLVAVLSMPGMTLTGVLAAVVANWGSIVAFIVALIPFILSYKAKEKQ